jgi:hypothetical protein
VATKVAMRTIPEPARGTRAVFSGRGAGTIAFHGEEEALSFLCGKCSSTLAKNVKGGQLNNLVLKCNQCGTYNEAII